MQFERGGSASPPPPPPPPDPEAVSFSDAPAAPPVPASMLAASPHRPVMVAGATARLPGPMPVAHRAFSPRPGPASSVGGVNQPLRPPDIPLVSAGGVTRFHTARSLRVHASRASPAGSAADLKSPLSPAAQPLSIHRHSIAGPATRPALPPLPPAQPISAVGSRSRPLPATPPPSRSAAFVPPAVLSQHAISVGASPVTGPIAIAPQKPAPAVPRPLAEPPTRPRASATFEPPRAVWSPDALVSGVFFAPPFQFADARASASEREALWVMLETCPFQYLRDLVGFTDDDSRRLAFDSNYSMRFVARLLAVRNEFWHRQLRAQVAADHGFGPAPSHIPASLQGSETAVQAVAHGATQAAAVAATVPAVASVAADVKSPVSSAMSDALSPRSTAEALGAGATYFRSFPYHYHPNDTTQYFVPHAFKTPAPQIGGALGPDGNPKSPAGASAVPRELVLTVAVPAFNEDADDLKRTLRSLHEQMPDLDLLGLRVHTLVIMDGWWKMHASTKAYLQKMFPGEWPALIQPIVPGKESSAIETCILQRVNHLPAPAATSPSAVAAATEGISLQPLFGETKSAPPPLRTGPAPPPVPAPGHFVTASTVERPVAAAVASGTATGLTTAIAGAMESKGPVIPPHFPTKAVDTAATTAGTASAFAFDRASTAVSPAASGGGRLQLAPVEIASGEHAFVSVLIKRDNRRKHNSHAWFLTAFAPAYDSDFIFLTDCGTIFSRHALFHMFKELWLHPTWTAATGRPRVMSAAQQGVGGENVLQAMCRAAQRFDFESSASSFTAAFSLVGMLPVLPGPCGFYRYPAVKDDAIPFYLEALNQNPDTAGMLLGSLLLAEDRVLSYAAVLKANNPEGAITAFIPEATFFFEAETDTEKLWTQRRRWINGTVAGYIWLVLNAGMIFRSRIPLIQKIMVTVLIVSQLLMYAVVVLAPSFLALGLNLSLRGDQGGVLDEYRVAIMIVYLGIYVYFVMIHARLGNGEKKVVIWLVHFVTLINAALSTWLMYWLVKENLNPDMKFSYPTLIVLTYLATPFVLALMQSPKSFAYMVVSFIPFVLYLPTMTGFWGAYAFSRLHDLTWGSRPSDTMLSAAAIASAGGEAAHAHGGTSTSAGTATQGLAPAHPHPPAATDAGKPQQSVEQFKAALEHRAHGICALIVVLNLLAVVSVLTGLQREQWGLYALSGFMFGFAFFQMLFSFVFFLVHRVRRIREGTALCRHVCCRCRSKTQFYRQMRGLPPANTHTNTHTATSIAAASAATTAAGGTAADAVSPPASTARPAVAASQPIATPSTFASTTTGHR